MSSACSVSLCLVGYLGTGGTHLLSRGQHLVFTRKVVWAAETCTPPGLGVM